MTIALPTKLDELLTWRWPHALDLSAVKHSDHAYTITLMDLDYKHYTFRMSLSLDDRWSLVPISGFEDNAERQLQIGESAWLTEAPDPDDRPRSTRIRTDTQPWPLYFA